MKKKPRAPKPKPFIATLAAASGPTLIRHLASCNASIRYESLKKIQSWLSSPQAQLSDDEMLRLWKGLFYCIWHSDKAPAQSQLISRLSSLLLTLDPLISLQYFDFFLVTLRREWNGIDHLRLDKFYLLIRRFVNRVFCLMRKYKWDLEYLGKYVELIENKAFLADDKLLGNGVSYHIASVFLDELKGFCVPLGRKEVVECLFRPFFGVMERSLDKVLVGKVKSCVFDVLLELGRGLLGRKKNGIDDVDGGKGDTLFGIIALKMGFSSRLYEVGSSTDCVQGNRKVVLGLHEEFLRLEKELETLGVDIRIPDVNEVDDGNDESEVPELIPIKYGESEESGPTQGVAEEGSSKNKKKNKENKPSDKKSKKKKKKKQKNGLIGNGVAVEENGGAVVSNGSEEQGAVSSDGSENGNLCPAGAVSNEILGTPIPSGELSTDRNELDFSEDVISNLQLQFEKVAAEMGGEEDELPLPGIKTKRKRAKSTNKPGNLEGNTQEDDGVDAGAKSSEKSAKKVRFAMKNNLVWKPQNPLPPQDLRLPPSLTPRGSALKKGVPPGPVREISPATKKVKRKKGRKILTTISPAVKRFKKIKVVSVSQL